METDSKTVKDLINIKGKVETKNMRNKVINNKKGKTEIMREELVSRRDMAEIKKEKIKIKKYMK
jgi:hypothetical protein